MKDCSKKVPKTYYLKPTTENGQPTTDNGQPTTENRQRYKRIEVGSWEWKEGSGKWGVNRQRYKIRDK